MPNLSLTDKYEQREMCLCVLSKRAELLKSTQGNYRFYPTSGLLMIQTLQARFMHRCYMFLLEKPQRIYHSFLKKLSFSSTFLLCEKTDMFLSYICKNITIVLPSLQKLSS